MASEVKSANLIVVTTTGQTSSSNPNVTMINAAYAMNANDQVILFDTNGTAGNITLPAVQNGKQLLFSPNNAGGLGGTSYTLVPSGTDTMDPAAPTTTTSFSSFKLIGNNGIWYAG